MKSEKSLFELSVIVPIFNKEKYLIRCVESLISQGDEIEIILVDDGSQDNSGKICDDYSLKYQNIRVIHKQNGGLMNARYEGICASKGKYITFVDADDWIKKDFYLSVLKICQENDVDLIDFGSNYYNENNSYCGEYVASYFDEGLYSREEIESTIIPWIHMYDCDGRRVIGNSLCMKVIKRSIIKEVYEIIEERNIFWGEDMLISFPCVIISDSIYIMHEKGYCYFVHDYFDKRKQQKYRDDIFKVYILLNRFYAQYCSNYEIINNLDYMYCNIIKNCSQKNNTYDGILFPFGKIKKGSRVVLWGAGKYGKKYFQQNDQAKYCDIVCWVDSYVNEALDRIIYSPLDFARSSIEYDYVVIAVKNTTAIETISNYLICAGIPEGIIVV